MPWIVYVGGYDRPPAFVFATPSRELAARMVAHLQLLVQQEQRRDIVVFFRWEDDE
jgi:hypothetical protein